MINPHLFVTFSMVIKYPVAVQITPDLFEIKEKARSLRL